MLTQKQIAELRSLRDQIIAALDHPQVNHDTYKRIADEAQDALAALTKRVAVKSKSYAEMTDEELVTEYQYLEIRNNEAASWGAAVGARSEDMKEIKKEQMKRRARNYYGKKD